MSSWLLPLLLAVAPVPDAGPQFADSALGYEVGGKGTQALDERWVSDLASDPLLMRVERVGDSGSVAFYALARGARADAGPVFEERLRVATGTAPTLDEIRSVALGKLGAGVTVQLHEDLPDDGNTQVLVIGRGPRVLLNAQAERFSLRLEGGDPVLTLVTDPKRLQLETTDGGAEVEVGCREHEYAIRGDAFAESSSHYHDLLPPLPLHSKAAPELVDGKLETGTTLKPGKPVRLDLDAAAPIRMLRIVPSCSKGKRGSAKQLHVEVGEGNALDVELGKVVAASGVRGSGLFNLGPGGGEQAVVLFDPPVTADHLTLSLTRGDGPGGDACLSEVSVHGLESTWGGGLSPASASTDWRGTSPRPTK